MYKNVRKILVLGLLTSFAAGSTLRAANDKQDDKKDGKKVENLEKLQTTKSVWNLWGLFGGKKTIVQPVEKAPEKAPEKTPEKPMGKGKIYYNVMKSVAAGSIPAGLCFYLTFFMPESGKKLLPKNYLKFLYDPKVVGPVWFAAGSWMSYKFMQGKQRFLDSKTVTAMGSQLIEKGISGAVGDEETKKNFVAVLMATLQEFANSNPKLLLDLAKQLGIKLSVFGGGGVSKDELKEIAEKIVDLLVKQSEKQGMRMEELFGFTHKKMDEHFNILLAETRKNRPLHVKLYDGMQNRLHGIASCLNEANVGFSVDTLDNDFSLIKE